MEYRPATDLVHRTPIAKGRSLKSIGQQMPRRLTVLFVADDVPLRRPIGREGRRYVVRRLVPNGSLARFGLPELIDGIPISLRERMGGIERHVTIYGGKTESYAEAERHFVRSRHKLEASGRLLDAIASR